jgi:alpha-1,2-mannosyltransferase
VTRRVLLAVLCGLLMAEAAAFAVLLPSHARHHNLSLEIISWTLFALALGVLAALGPTTRRAGALIIGAGIAFQLIAVLTPPTSSDDDFRYLWDAKVQLSGTDPYRYAPAAPELDHLRTHLFLYPPWSGCPWPIPQGCSAINRPTVRTVYPPVAEGVFTAIRLASFGGHGNHLPLQLTAALGSIVVAWLLYRRRVKQNRPLWTVAIWAWCPVTVIEYGNNAHIDWLAVLLAVLALTARRATAIGGLAGAAIATKLYPALILPSLLKRRPLVVLAGAVALVAVSYLPHVLAVGAKVIGYLPGYLREEHYASGQRFLLLPIGRSATVIAVLVLVGVAAWVVRRSDPDRPEDTAVVLVGAAILVTTPSYGWYAGLLVALIALSGRPAWLPVALAPGLWYLLRGDVDAPTWVGRGVFAAALVLSLAGGSVGRAGRERHRLGVRLARRVGPGERDLVAGVVGADEARQIVR